jgi:hypothetical protein
MKQYVTICIACLALVFLWAACTSNNLSFTPTSSTPTAIATILSATSTPTLPTPTGAKTPTPSPTTTSVSENAAPELQVLNWDGLILEDYALSSAQGISLPDGGDFYASLPPSLIEKQQALLQSNNWPTITQTNAILAPFGYRLEGDFQYALYDENNLLKDGLPGFGSISVGQSKRDFAIIVGDWDNTWLVHKGQIEAWDKPQHFNQVPFFLGDDLLMITQVMTEDERFGVRLERNGQTIFEQPISYVGAEGCPVEQFREWGEHWILEVEADIFVDGVSLAKITGYEQTFNWELMKNKPIYLFQQDDGVGIVYDDQVIPLQYEQIVHYQCVDKYGGAFGAYNVAQNSQILSFFALKGGRWHFVQILPDGN